MYSNNYLSCSYVVLEISTFTVMADSAYKANLNLHNYTNVRSADPAMSR